jgi:single-stranded-DNA-specific exonuclease
LQVHTIDAEGLIVPAKKIWRLLPADPEAAQRLAARLKISTVVAQLLLNRGISDEASARQYLDGRLNDLHDPSLLGGMSQAVARLVKAIEQRQRICVFGDYDVDGISGTAILVRLLEILKANFEWRLPQRRHGYGISPDIVTELAERGVRLLVTVDCGITAVEAIRAANQAGMDVIITDHHSPKAELPPATALIHPNLPGQSYPFAGLSGAGVAFKLAWALCRHVSGGAGVPTRPDLREFLHDALGLASLGLIADVVPLQDENRIFVKHGLKRLHERTPLGLRSLLQVMEKSSEQPLRAEFIAFHIAPRMNAAGRLDRPDCVLELLTTQSVAEAQQLALQLDQKNKDRRRIESEIIAAAREMIDEHGYDDAPALVLGHPSWHFGVVGIVAGRLAEEYARPVLLAGDVGGLASGSGRSIPGFAIHEALAHCADLLVRYGGHPAAAGFCIPWHQLDALRERFTQYAAAHFPDGMPPPPVLHLDAELPLLAINKKLLNDLDHLEPFGAANPKPCFLATNLHVDSVRRIGENGRHLNFRVSQEGRWMRVIMWNQGQRLNELINARRCSLAFTPKINVYQGEERIELNADDFQIGDEPQLA